MALPHAQISYDLSGPANHQPPGRPDNNNFAPRFSLAYSPVNPGASWARFFGKGGVLSRGAAWFTTASAAS